MITTALLFATAEAAEGGPAAGVRLPGGATLAGRLVEQLVSLGVPAVRLVTRPAWADELREATGAVAGADVEVHASEDPAEDLRQAAAVARAVRGRLFVGAADVLIHREALAGLLADPRLATGVLVTSAWWKASFGYRLRSARGRVVSAASAYHAVGSPTGYFLNFLKVDARDRGALAAVAEELAGLVDPAGRPAAWDEELARKGDDWRVDLWRRATERRTGVWPPMDEVPPPAELELDPEEDEVVAVRLRAAPNDIAPLLLTGLVRTGTHVGQSHIRGFFHQRPLSAAAAARAAADMATVDEDGIALASAVKATDGFFTTFFVSPYSRYIARFAARRGWTPNAMTTVSMAIGTLAAVAFALGSRAGMIAGALLLQAAFTVDCVDGQLARYTRTFSKLGAWLDSVFDRGKEYVVYAGLAIGATRGFGQDVWTLAAAALTLQTVRHVLDFAFAATRHQAIASAPRVPLADVADQPLPIDLPRRSPAEAVPAAAGGATAVAAPPRRPAPAPVKARPSAPEGPGGIAGLARSAVSLMGRLDKIRGVLWAKRILVLPIGERFALISITAALWSPRTTFIALLVWGGIAATYAVPGRILRSLAR